MALKVGVEGKSALQAAKELNMRERTAQWRVNRPEVKAANAKYNHEVAEQCRLTSERIIKEDMRIAFGDIADFIDDDGIIRPIHEVPEHVRAAISRILQRESGTRYEFYSKHQSLQRLHEFMGHFQRNDHKEGGTPNAMLHAIVQMLATAREDNV